MEVSYGFKGVTVGTDRDPSQAPRKVKEFKMLMSTQGGVKLQIRFTGLRGLFSVGDLSTSQAIEGKRKDNRPED